MAELRMDANSTDAEWIVFEEPDSEGEMKAYLAGAGSAYLTPDQRRQLIIWLESHTPGEFEADQDDMNMRPEGADQ